MSTEEQLSEIQRTLGKLLEAADRQRKDFDEERRAAAESRSHTHRRIDELHSDIDTRFRRTEESINIAGQVAAQARSEVQELKKIVDEDVKPQTDDIKKLRLMGLGFFAAIGIGGTLFGITLANVGEGILGAIYRLFRVQ